MNKRAACSNTLPIVVMKKITIYWPPSTGADIVKKIRERFGITGGTTINGETPAEIKDEDMPLLEETANRGFISLRKYKPSLDGLLKLHEKCTE